MNSIPTHLKKRHCNGFERFCAKKLLEYSLDVKIPLKEFSQSFCSKHNLTGGALVDALRLLASEGYFLNNFEWSCGDRI